VVAVLPGSRCWATLLDQMFFWNATDLQKKLTAFQHYYNEHRTHAGIEAQVPAKFGKKSSFTGANLHHFQWQSFCRGLFRLLRIA
jgi:hypothetical protein